MALCEKLFNSHHLVLQLCFQMDNHHCLLWFVMPRDIELLWLHRLIGNRPAEEGLFSLGNFEK